MVGVKGTTTSSTGIVLVDSCQSATYFNEYFCYSPSNSDQISQSAGPCSSYGYGGGCVDGACVSCATDTGNACNDNACGGGTIQCDGTCSIASAPACDITQPAVSGSYSPSSPNNVQNITFTGTATDSSGINWIEIYIDGVFKKVCTNYETSCNYVSGSMSSGYHTFMIRASDRSPNYNISSASYGFTVAGPPNKVCSRSASNGVSILYSTLEASCSDYCNGMGYTSALGYNGEIDCLYPGSGQAGWSSNTSFNFNSCSYSSNTKQYSTYNLCWFGSLASDPETIECSCSNSCNVNVGNDCNRNACGGSGTIQCNGACSATAPTLYGTANCNRNTCGGTGTTNNCTGACSASAPTLYGTAACNRNACGGTGTTNNCTGACSASAPSLYGTAACN